MPFKTTDERMHMAMMQQQGGHPMMPIPMAPYGHPNMVYQQQKAQKKGRRRDILEQNGDQTPKKHTGMPEPNKRGGAHYSYLVSVHYFILTSVFRPRYWIRAIYTNK